jgi:hypothetical protein
MECVTVCLFSSVRLRHQIIRSLLLRSVLLVLRRQIITVRFLLFFLFVSEDCFDLDLKSRRFC